MTALMYAAREGHVDRVRLLLDRAGGWQDTYGTTVLMCAVQNKDNDTYESVSLLWNKECVLCGI